jgi:hypothetical protein
VGAVAEPQTTPVSPWNPAAAPVARDGPGCSKPLLLGCGALLVLLGIGAVAFVIAAPSLAPRMMRWWFHTLETTLEPRLPADLSPAERQRLHRGFEEAARAAGSGKADLASMRAFQRKMMKLMPVADPQVKLSHKDVQDLTESLEALSHGGRNKPPGGDG